MPGRHERPEPTWNLAFGRTAAGFWLIPLKACLCPSTSVNAGLGRAREDGDPAALLGGSGGLPGAAGRGKALF